VHPTKYTTQHAFCFCLCIRARRGASASDAPHPGLGEHRSLRFEQDQAYEESLAADRWGAGDGGIQPQGRLQEQERGRTHAHVHAHAYLPI